MSGSMNLTLKIWRQKNDQEPGKLETYELPGVSPDMSFLEMLDVLNEQLMVKGEDPVAFDHDCREGICGMCSLVINGQAHGSAWGFQQRGHPRIGFNTDAPVVPQEELPLQAAMGVRYGMDNSHMDAVRGVTIIPALTAGIAHRVGSLEPGKDADLVVVGGDPVDPRSGVEAVFIEGRLVYDAREGRRW